MNLVSTNSRWRIYICRIVGLPCSWKIVYLMKMFLSTSFLIQRYGSIDEKKKNEYRTRKLTRWKKKRKKENKKAISANTTWYNNWREYFICRLSNILTQKCWWILYAFCCVFFLQFVRQAFVSLSLQTICHTSRSTSEFHHIHYSLLFYYILYIIFFFFLQFHSNVWQALLCFQR